MFYEKILLCVTFIYIETGYTIKKKEKKLYLKLTSGGEVNPCLQGGIELVSSE